MHVLRFYAPPSEITIQWNTGIYTGIYSYSLIISKIFLNFNLSICITCVESKYLVNIATYVALKLNLLCRSVLHYFKSRVKKVVSIEMLSSEIGSKVNLL